MKDDDDADFLKDAMVEWSRLEFRDLYTSWEASGDQLEASAYARELIARYGDIMNIVKSDNIWPPTASSNQLLAPALCEVLSRLPQEDFDFVESNVSFIVEDPKLTPLAFNVPAKGEMGRKIGLDRIVFFESSWLLSPKALIGLVAHELAHSFVTGKDDTKDELLVNQRVCDWGFQDELICLQREKPQLKACANSSA